MITQDDITHLVNVRARKAGLNIQSRPFEGESMVLNDGRVLRLDTAPGFWREVDADAGLIRAVALEMIDEFAIRHGPGAVWSMCGLPLVHLVEDDGRFEFNGKVRLRRFLAHEATAKPAPAKDPSSGWFDFAAHAAAETEAAIAAAIDRETERLWREPVTFVSSADTRRDLRLGAIRTYGPLTLTREQLRGAPALPDQQALAREAVASHRPFAGADRATPVESLRRTTDPLAAVTDGWTLRDLLTAYENAQREGTGLMMAGGVRAFTPAQRAAVSARWSAELRAKVAASTAADKERERTRVVVDQEDD